MIAFSPDAWWQPKPEGTTHEVRLLCACDDVEACRTEIYASDVRIAHAEIRTLRAQLAGLQGIAQPERA